MVAPPPREDLRAYLRVARHLRALGVSAPAVFGADEATGLALIEDFGEDTFSRLLERGEDARPLYRLAVDLLVHLQANARAALIDLPPYDRPTLLREAELFTRWYWPEATGGSCPPEAAEAYLGAWEGVLEGLDPGFAPTLVVRDFHVDNLMAVAGRQGTGACGVLDFQDALLGHPAYDLVSLLEDARRDLSADLAAEMRERYLAARPELRGEAFSGWYRALGAQRHCKVAGIFVRLSRRDGKHGYRRHLPRVLRLLRGHLDEAPLEPLRDWARRYLPELLAAERTNAVRPPEA